MQQLLDINNDALCFYANEREFDKLQKLAKKQCGTKFEDIPYERAFYLLGELAVSIAHDVLADLLLVKKDQSVAEALHLLALARGKIVLDVFTVDPQTEEPETIKNIEFISPARQGADAIIKEIETLALPEF
jgi:hypothetical protein